MIFRSQSSKNDIYSLGFQDNIKNKNFTTKSDK